eukprot:scaffold23854_cov54-Phaeocystis_antarctica.AAC.2
MHHHRNGSSKIGADSIKGDVQLAPTQAQRHDPQRTSTRANTVSLRPRPKPEAAELSTDQFSSIPITRAGQARSRSGRRGCSQEQRAGAMRAGTSRQPACRPPAPQSHRAVAPASLQRDKKVFAQHNKFGITLQVDEKFLNYHLKTVETVATSAETAEKTVSPEAAAQATRIAAAAKEQAKAKQAAAAKAKVKAKAKASEKEERRLLAEAVTVAAREARALKAAKAAAEEVKPEPEPAKEQDGAAKAAKSEAEEAEAAMATTDATEAEATRLGAEAARPLVQARSSPAGPATHATTYLVAAPSLSQVQVEIQKGQTIMVDANLQQPSGALHEDVSERSGLPADTFELYHGSKRLEGEAVLASWGVEKDSLIEVKTRGPGGMHGGGGGGGGVDGGGGVEGGGGETDSCLEGVGGIGGVGGVGSGSSSDVRDGDVG